MHCRCIHPWEQVRRWVLVDLSKKILLAAFFYCSNILLMSELPKIVKKQSVAVRLQPGTYFYCRCGLSEDQPWCDGAHQGTDFRPKKFSVQEPREVYLCLCKHSKNSPFCDGVHRTL